MEQLAMRQMMNVRERVERESVQVARRTLLEGMSTVCHDECIKKGNERFAKWSHDDPDEGKCVFACMDKYIEAHNIIYKVIFEEERKYKLYIKENSDIMGSNVPAPFRR